MPDDTITLVSTTDSPEEVQAALTGKPPAETPPADKPDETKAAETKPADAPPAETPEQKDAREASEAGSRLAKRKQSIQQEIDELTRNKHNVRRDVEAEEARLMDLRRQREETERQVAPDKPAPKTDTPKLEDDELPEPKLDAVDDKGDAKYATYEDYLSDHAKWTKAQAAAAARLVVLQEREAERARIERDSTDRVVHGRLAEYNTALETFKKTHADFDAVFAEAKAEVQDTLVALGPEALKVVDGYTVFDAEDGPALTYYLLKHPDELKAVAMKPPQQQLIHLARLEERIRPAGAKKEPARSQTAPETKAPEPIKPVGSGPTATTVPSDEESYQDYKARRERELRTRRGA
jgi:hypothetical protein